MTPKKKREMIKNLLQECNEAQIDVFKRMYGSVEEIPPKKLDHAMSQCQNTVHKNWGVE